MNNKFLETNQEASFILKDATICHELIDFINKNANKMAAAGNPLIIKVCTPRSNRNYEQNARYWAILRKISGQAIVRQKMYDSGIWHEYFKGKFIGLDDLPNGKQVPMSSARLTIKDFSEYMDKVEAYAVTELGVQFEN